MAQIPQDLEQRVALLSADEKARLALYLLESLEPADDGDGDLDDAWRDESDRRLGALQRGEAQSVAADDALRRQPDGGQP